MMSGYAAKVNIHVAALVINDDSADEQDVDEQDTTDKYVETWARSLVLMRTPGRRLYPSPMDGKDPWVYCCDKEKAKPATHARKRRKKGRGNKFGAKKSKAKKQPHAYYRVAASSIQCEMEFSKGRLTAKLVKELEVFI
jgi:hypothetical protein